MVNNLVVLYHCYGKSHIAHLLAICLDVFNKGFLCVFSA